MAQRRGIFGRAQDRFFGGREDGGRGRDDPYRTYGDDEDRPDQRYGYGPRFRDEDEDEREYAHRMGRLSRFSRRDYSERGGFGPPGYEHLDPDQGIGASGLGYPESLSGQNDPGANYGGLQGSYGSQGGRVSAPYVGGVQRGASWAQESWGRENPLVPFYGHAHGDWQTQQGIGPGVYRRSTHGRPGEAGYGEYGRAGRDAHDQGTGPSRYGQNTYSAQYGQSGFQSGYAPSDPQGFVGGTQQGQLGQGQSGQGHSGIQQTGYGQGTWAQHAAEHHGHHDADYGRWRHEQLRNMDTHYQNWRDDQARQFDDEYTRYRRERHAEFSSRFEDWRKTNQGALPQTEQNDHPGNVGVHASVSGVGSGSGTGDVGTTGTWGAGSSGSPGGAPGASGTTVSGAPSGSSTGSGSAGGTGSGSSGTLGIGKTDKDKGVGPAKH